MKYSYNYKMDGVVCEPNCVEEILKEIIYIGTDYDGCGTMKSLENLVDEIVNYANRGLRFMGHNKITVEDVEEEDRESYEAAWRIAEDRN